MQIHAVQPIEALCEGSALCDCQPLTELPAIRSVCAGSPFCSCPVRTEGGTLLSRYKKGEITAKTRAANAAYMREYRRRQLPWNR